MAILVNGMGGSLWEIRIFPYAGLNRSGFLRYEGRWANIFVQRIATESNHRATLKQYKSSFRVKAASPSG